MANIWKIIEFSLEEFQMSIIIKVVPRLIGAATCIEKRIQYKYSAPDHRDVLEILSAALQDLILLHSISAHVIIVSEKLI